MRSSEFGEHTARAQGIKIHMKPDYVVNIANSLMHKKKGSGKYNK
jgi:hypothetical protein